MVSGAAADAVGRFSVTAIDVSAHDSAAYVRVIVSFEADGHEPWMTAGVSSDMNQAALMAIVDGFPSLAAVAGGAGGDAVVPELSRSVRD